MYGMSRPYNLEVMPRLRTSERVERARDAIASAVEAVEADLDRGDYDAAWKAAEELSHVLDVGRSANSRARSRIVATLTRRERYKLRQVAERFGVSVQWVARLSAASKAEEIPADLPTTEPGQ
jgi:hypothetical protein